MNITVIRGNGDRPGDDIEDVLMATIPVALQRGRNAVDEAALAENEQITMSLQSAVRLGDLVEVLDSSQGIWRGKVTGIEHRVAIDDAGNISAESQLDIRRPR